MKNLIYIFLITILPFFNSVCFAQSTIAEISTKVDKGTYSIIEVRLNMEDEFRTLEGRESQGLARISIYTGKNQNNEVLTKGFQGFNTVVNILNEMRQNGWKLVDTYPVQGSSLILTHYVFEKVKK